VNNCDEFPNMLLSEQGKKNLKLRNFWEKEAMQKCSRLLMRKHEGLWQ
jgi:hypothetical protein